MRLWTVHPKYLDYIGLVAVWREGLLAQAVLQGQTRGYKKHPQLLRFKAHQNPTAMVGCYLSEIYKEAVKRQYAFKREKIKSLYAVDPVEESEGQLLFEWQHLLLKLKSRSPDQYHRFKSQQMPEAHPLFLIVPGSRQTWEKG